MNRTNSVYGGGREATASNFRRADSAAPPVENTRTQLLNPITKAVRLYYGHVLSAGLAALWVNMALADVVGPTIIPYTPVGQCAPDASKPTQVCAEINAALLADYQGCLARQALDPTQKCRKWPSAYLASRPALSGLGASTACRTNGVDGYEGHLVDFWPTCGPDNTLQPEKNLGGCDGGAGQAMEGNPINVATGNKYQLDADFHSPATSLRVARHYNSQAVRDGRFGTNWTDHYQRSIMYETDGATGANRKDSATLRRPDGRIIRFTRPNDGDTWVSESGERGTLVRTRATVAGNPNNLAMFAIASRDGGYVGGRVTVDGDPDGWTYVNDNNELETYSGYSALYADTYYDGAHRLEKIEGAAGGVQTLTYTEGQVFLDGNHWGWGRTYQQVVDRVIDENSRQLLFSYDGKDRVIGVSTPAQVLSYEYSDSATLSAALGLGRTALARVTYPGGATRQYRYAEPPLTAWTATPVQTFTIGAVDYNAPQYSQLGLALPPTGVDVYYSNALTGVIDENGNRYATWGHDTKGRAFSSEHASGGIDKYVFNYGDGYGASIVTDPLGTKRAYTFGTFGGIAKPTSVSQPGGSGCGAASSATTYDVNGNVTSEKDFNGNQVCYTNDMSRNLPLTTVSGLAQSAACEPVNVSGATLPAGALKVSTQWHPQWKLPVKVSGPLRQITHVYNGQPDPFNGNAIASCALGAKLSNGWPLAVLCKSVAQATTDANGALGFNAALQPGVPNRVQSFTYNTRGQVLTATDALGNKTTYSYYASTTPAGSNPFYTVGDLQTVTAPNGQVVTFNSYTPSGRLLKVTDPNGLVTTTTYDSRERRTSITSGSETTTWNYDSYDPATKLSHIKTTLPDGTVLTQTLDVALRVVKVTDAAGNKVEYTLDNAGNRTGEKVTDASGVLVKNITRVFDALGRLYTVKGAAQ